jgi:hypothetical protein
MAANNIALIEKYSTKAWDTVYKQESMSAMLDASNSLMVQFEGAKTVKIAKWQNGGLHDYYRNNVAEPERVPGNLNATGHPGNDKFINQAGFGYQKSGVRLVWEEFTMKCDRAAAFQIEKFDNEESGGQLVGLGVAEISRTVIVPEVDAYCFSTIASYCTEKLENLVKKTYSGEPKEDTPIADLNKAFVYFANHEVPVTDQIVFCSPDFINALRNTQEVTKFLAQADYSKDINFQIMKYQGRTLVEVSPERLRTNILLFGQEGYTWAADSKKINFLMVAKSAVMHVTKYEKVKVIGDDLNLAGQGFDGYTIFARIYHDVFVPDNKRYALYCSVEEEASTAPAMTLDVTIKNGRIDSIVTYPGEKIAFVGTTTGTPTVGATLTASAFVAARVGDKVTGNAKFVAVDGNMKVLAIYEHTAATAE